MASAYLKKYPDGVILFYDSEFGTPQSYFDTFKIPYDNVIHSPITDIEELKFDIMHQLKTIDRNDRVFIVIDSIGNLASKKEVEDAENQKSVADMSRAKQLKSLFRMLTPHLTLKDIPMAVINHTYEDMGMYPKQIIGGGTGSYYGSDNIWIIGRQQEKEGNDIAGYHFVINVEKSRYVKEKSRIPITVSFENGINRWSGLFDIAIEAGYITKPKVGWYRIAHLGEESKLYRAGEIATNKSVWADIFSNTDLATYIEKKYKMATGTILEDEDEEVA